MQQKACLQPKYQCLSAQNYLQGLSNGPCTFIADFVAAQTQCLERLVHLQEIDRKDTVSGAANQTQNDRKTRGIVFGGKTKK